AARKLLNARLTSVWIYNESTQLLDLRAHDPADEAFQVRTLRMDDSLGGWVLQLGKPFVNGDIGHHPLWKHALASDTVVRGGVVVPLYDREQPLGILIALGEHARAFDQQDIELLDTLAGQVGVAVQNARHFAAARDQTRRLSTLMRVNRHLTLGRRIEEILETIAEDAANLIGGEAAGIRLVEQGNLVHVASFGAEAAMVVREQDPTSEGLTGEVVRANAAVQTTDLTRDERVDPRHRALAAKLGFRGWLGVPLRGRTEVVGVVYILTRRKHEFSAHEIQLLDAFANQAAMAIENARLYAKEQSRQRQLESIREFSSDLSQELDLDRVLELAVLGAVELVHAPLGALYLWDNSDRVLRRSAASDHARGFPLETVTLGSGVSGTAASRRISVVVNDYQDSPLALEAVAESGTVIAALSEPIMYQDRLLGVITLAHDEPTRAFTSEDGQIISIFAGRVAIAIENCRLFKQAARAEALDELARLKTEFLSTVSHELRTPLSLIHGYSELLIARGERLNSEQVQEMAREIHTGSRTMARLVDDLLDFSRIEQDRMELKCVPVSLTEILNTVSGEFSGSLDGSRLSAAIEGGMSGVVDPDRLKQVVGGLLANAARFAPDGPITLQASLQAGVLSIDVTDQGPGVPENEQERVWEKFFRGAAAVNSPLRGSGLGLALVKHVVTLHGGTVGVQSTLGHGATFWIRMPV
ncbi:MAG: GAF domain-containing protein, partial [Chloroflexota bacterium]